MGNNISHAFNNVFTNRHIRRTSTELCELIETNVDYSVSLGHSVCHFMFYDHYYNDDCVSIAKERLIEKGISLEECTEYPNRKEGEKMLIVTIL